MSQRDLPEKNHVARPSNESWNAKSIPFRVRSEIDARCFGAGQHDALSYRYADLGFDVARDQVSTGRRRTADLRRLSVRGGRCTADRLVLGDPSFAALHRPRSWLFGAARRGVFRLQLRRPLYGRAIRHVRPRRGSVLDDCVRESHRHVACVSHAADDAHVRCSNARRRGRCAVVPARPCSSAKRQRCRARYRLRPRGHRTRERGQHDCSTQSEACHSDFPWHCVGDAVWIHRGRNRRVFPGNRLDR